MPIRFCRSMRRAGAAGLLIGLAAALSACALSDESLSRITVAPDKFVLYNCPELVDKARALAARQRELEQLMARAGTDAGGRMVSEMAYRPEYGSVRGEIVELRKSAAAKDCPAVEAALSGAPALAPAPVPPAPR